jgi:hypothetical protein
MGQYFALVNLDKKQWVHAHRIGMGLKIGEQTGTPYSTETVARLLLKEPEAMHSLIGSWHGDTRVGFVGDYGGSHPAPGLELHDDLQMGAEDIYREADDQNPEWKEISADVRGMMTAVFGVTYTGDGWLDIIKPSGEQAKVNLRPDIVLGM